MAKYKWIGRRISRIFLFSFIILNITSGKSIVIELNKDICNSSWRSVSNDYMSFTLEFYKSNNQIYGSYCAVKTVGLSVPIDDCNVEDISPNLVITEEREDCIIGEYCSYFECIMITPGQKGNGKFKLTKRGDSLVWEIIKKSQYKQQDVDIIPEKLVLYKE